VTLAEVRLAIAATLLAGEASAAPGSAATAIAVSYVAISAWAVLRLRRRASAAPTSDVALPAADLAAAVTLTLASNSSLVHFVPLFVLVATAYRAGVARTAVSGAVMAAALALETHPGVQAVFGHPVLSTHIYVLSGYTLVAAVLIGHLVQRERGLRSESTALGRLFEHLRLDAGPVASIRTVLEQIRVVFGARQVLLAVDETEDGLAFVWRTRTPRSTAEREPIVSRLGVADRAQYWFPTGMFAGACLLARTGDVLRVAAAVGEGGDEVSAPPVSAREFAAAHPAARMLLLPHVAVGTFRLRLFVLDPRVERADDELRLLQTLARRFAPLVHNLYLERHLRTRLQEFERARLARELHDGVIQSLIAIEMRLDLARRQIDSAPATAAGDLVDAQRQLRDQVVDVRALMNQLRPPNVGHRRLVQHLSEATERFHRTTGIDARFEGGVERLELPTRVCGELVRVVDEALINVQKHSGARRVDVRLGAIPGALTLSIEDDGRGFGFAGRMTQPDLDAQGLGPLVIKERVNAIGGRVAIDSVPGRGSRIEVQVPRPAADHRLLAPEPS
jgi:signal transduction histidine kinase